MAPWWQRVRECQVARGSAGDLGVTLGGGADRGELPYLVGVRGGHLRSGVLHPGDLLLEVNGSPVCGLTLGDTLGVLRGSRDPVTLRTVNPGSDLSKDLSAFLQRSCSCHSRDNDLQKIVRDNLYLRAIPCTTRQPHDGEIAGVDYTFISTQEFLALQEKGLLLESGTHKGHYYGTPRPLPVAEDSAMTQRGPRHRAWGPNQRYLSLSAEEELEELSDEGEQEDEEDGQAGVLMGLTLQDGDLGLRREIPGCVDPSSSNRFPRAPNCHWKQETMERLGLNFSAQVAPLLQVVRGSSALCGPDRGLSTCGDFTVVVHGNCIVEYSKGERLTLHSTTTRGTAVEQQQTLDRPFPLLPPPRVPACGQEAETDAEAESSGKKSQVPLQPEVRPPHKTSPISSSSKAPVNIPLLGPSLLPLPSHTISSSQRPEEGPSVKRTEQQKGAPEVKSPASDSPRFPSGPQKGFRDGSTAALAALSLGSSDTPESASSRLTPVPLSRSSGGLGFQVTAAGPSRGAVVTDIWDRRACPLLAEGDVIVKANGADLRNLTAAEVEEVLQQRTLEGDMVLLVQREALRVPISIGAPALDVSMSRLLHTSRHRPQLLRSATEDGEASRRVPVSPSSPDNMNRRHGHLGDIVSVGVQARRDTEAWSRIQPPQTHSHSSNESQGHNRGITMTVKPTRLAPQASEGWPSPDETIKATSFMDPVPCDLMLGQRSLPQTLADLDTHSSYGATAFPGSQATAPVARLSPASDQGIPLTLASRLKEMVLERREDEGFGFVIVSEIPASGQEARSLVPHRVSEVRQESPAGREGQLQVGDHLEGVDGRSIAHLSPREITQLFRNAGNKIRLRILPKSQSEPEGLFEAAEIEVDEKRTPSSPVALLAGVAKSLGPRDPPTQPVVTPESRQYLVELQRGPTGFGFSLRGGSEYKMDVYVLGIMEGGPAEKSGKMQVSDRLLEINGTSTASMSHPEAVEHIRSGGNKIRLLLSRGNGYVPDYDTNLPRRPSCELVLEKRIRPDHLELNPVAEQQSEQPPLVATGMKRGVVTTADALSGTESMRYGNRKHPGTTRLPDKETLTERTSPGRSSHPSSRKEPTVAREGRQHARRSDVRAATLTPGTKLGRNEDLPQQLPRESKSLSPQWNRALGSGLLSGSLMGPRLRPSVEPGPWLVPSRERLSYTLQKDSGFPHPQGEDGGFAGGFQDMEAAEREKGEAMW